MPSEAPCPVCRTLVSAPPGSAEDSPCPLCGATLERRRAVTQGDSPAPAGPVREERPAIGTDQGVSPGDATRTGVHATDAGQLPTIGADESPFVPAEERATLAPGEPGPGDYPFLAPPEQTGELGRLGKYRVLERLSVGGMGSVFRAEDTVLGRSVALKVMLTARSFDPVGRARFVREARALANLESDHVVTVFDAGDEGGVLYLCMALLKGETLQQRLAREKRLPVAAAVRVARQMAAGLADAHAAEVVHRDVKPSNTWLVAGSDQVKLLDFGLARVADGGAGLTVTRAVMGTPAYMAPEQIKSSKHVDHRADQFALGCVLYEMLTGANPFADRSKLGTFRRVLDHTPPRPDASDAAVPPELGVLVLRLLSKTPEGRFETTREIVDALDAIAARLGPLDGPLGANTTTVSGTAPARPRRRWRAAAVVALVIASVAVAAVALRRPAPPPTPPEPPAAPDQGAGAPVVPPSGPRKEFQNALGMTMVLVPEGSYVQGSPATEPGRKADEGPQRKVLISRPLYFGRHEVTVGEFRRFVDATGHRTFPEQPKGFGFRLDADKNSFVPHYGYSWRSPRWAQTDRHPVVCVNWNDAVAFCAWLSRQEGRIYRLPTEAEWEYAIRGGTTTPYYLGRGLRAEDGRTPLSGVNEPVPVGQFPANPFGLCDLIGNVDEWVLDRYEPEYRAADRVNPAVFRGPGGDVRGVRGASFAWDTRLGRSAARGHPEPRSVSADRTGFRVVAEPTPGDRPDADERAAAEVLVRNGATVEVAVGDRPAAAVAQCDELPDGAFRVTAVELVDLPWVTGEHLAWATRFPALTRVAVAGCGAGEELPKHLARLTALTHLTVGRYRSADALFAEVARLERLRELDLTDTPVTDPQSLRHLQRLPALARLALSGAQIDDSAVPHLEQLKALTRLQLTGTAVTDAGLDRLRAALPRCEVESKPAAAPAP